MTIETTRRAVLAGAPAIALVATIPGTLTAAPNGLRRDWEGALRAYQQIKAEDEAFTTYWKECNAACKAGAPSLDSIHWKEFGPAGHVPRFREQIAMTMDLDEEWQKFLAGEGHWWNASDPEKPKAKFRAALDSVQAYRDAYAANYRDSGLEDADRRFEEFGEAVSEAEWALMDTPAPDLAALHWKLEFLFADDGTDACSAWSSNALAPTLPDIARLLPPAA
jgi:hypothetical protein